VSTTELAVVGGGPAGLAAAVTAARAGATVTLIDEQQGPGGQYLTGMLGTATRPPMSATERQGNALLHDLAEVGVNLRTETLAWDLSADLRLALYGPSSRVLSGGLSLPKGLRFDRLTARPSEDQGLRSDELRGVSLWDTARLSKGVSFLDAKAVVVASGARETVVPFPGWTLPGVMTAGAAQLLAKKQGVLPGRRVLLAGSGPLLLSSAYYLAEHGADVVAVLEATRPGQWLRHAPAIWGNLDRLGEGWHYLGMLLRSRIPYRFGRTAVQALGKDKLEAVVVARLDHQGRPITGSEETIPVDTLCLGFGLVPNIELAQIAGSSCRFDSTRGGWVPQVDDYMETTIPNLFVAGEAAGVDGAGAAMLEGRIAGLVIAQRLGYIGRDVVAGELAALTRRRRRLRRFGAMLNTLFVPPAGLATIITDDTIVCRCEEVRAGEVRAALVGGATTLDAIKTWTRVGQGPCQGRTCGPILARMVAQQRDCSLEKVGCFHVRPPLKPVPVGSLAQGALT